MSAAIIISDLCVQELQGRGGSGVTLPDGQVRGRIGRKKEIVKLNIKKKDMKGKKTRRYVNKKKVVKVKRTVKMGRDM